jgi:hypothetical protein
MASPKVHLTFVDGHSEEVTLNPRVLVEVERKYGGTIPPIEGSLYGAWFRLGQPGKFDDWLDSIDDMTEQAKVDAGPSGPVPSDGS